jgi:hypothetical protein
LLRYFKGFGIREAFGFVDVYYLRDEAAGFFYYNGIALAEFFEYAIEIMEIGSPDHGIAHLDWL